MMPVNFFQRLFSRLKSDSKAPILIINKEPEVIEYDSIEVAIAELEKDPEIPLHKMDKIRASFEELKSMGKIKIKNGEIIR